MGPSVNLAKKLRLQAAFREILNNPDKSLHSIARNYNVNIKTLSSKKTRNLLKETTRAKSKRWSMNPVEMKNLNIDVLKYYKKHGKINVEKLVNLAKPHRESNDNLEPSKRLDEHIRNYDDFKGMVQMDHIKKRKRVTRKKVKNISRDLFTAEQKKPIRTF